MVLMCSVVLLYGIVLIFDAALTCSVVLRVVWF